MHDNNTVQQLSDALTELLDAYDKLKHENTNLQQENKNKDNKISELEARDKDLEDQIEQLTDTTEQNTSEIDTMLGRIKTILDDGSQTANDEPLIEDFEEEAQMSFSQSIEQSEDNILSVVESELSIQEQTTINIDQEEKKPSTNSDKEIDLGRMQSLLNGFNN